MTPRRLWLFGLGLVSAQKLSCSSTADTKGHGLQVFQTRDTNTDFCSNMEATDSVGELVDTCAAFCGTGNIPLLVGIPSYGFNHADIDTVCLAEDDSLAKYNATLMNNCRIWSQALRLIKTRAADLVAALDNMTMAQLNFKVGIALKSKELAATMASEQTRDRLLSVVSSRTAAEFRSILENGVADFLANGRYRMDLQDTMQVLRQAGLVLNMTLNENLGQLDDFVEHCGDLLVSTAPNEQYLLDICIQQGAVCLDHLEAKHIGCCCSTIPLGGTFGITGETPRRLAEEVPIDVCAEAEVTFSAERQLRESELRGSAEGEQLLKAHLDALRTAYPDYYTESNCRARRLDESPSEPMKATAGSRQLQAQLACSPQSAVNGSYKVAFWAETEENYCSNIPTGTEDAMTDQGLSDICKSFCGEDAIPLNIGGVYFGFNQTTMEEICLGGDIIEANESFVETCHGHARAMQDVQVKLAAFVASLSVLEAEKTLYEANAKKAAADMKLAIEERAATVLQAALVPEKILKLKELLIEQTSSMKTSGTAYGAIKRAVEDVRAKGNELQSTLSQSLSSLDILVTDCNKLFTGLGRSREYLLDICSQTSTACIEQDVGRHAGCCCGYSPLITLGTASVPSATIDGLENARFAGDARARVAARRLSTPYSICGEAQKASKATVDAAHNEVKALGLGALITEQLQRMARRYPDQYGCYFPNCLRDTGGTCAIFGCDASRGETECMEGKCQCAEGHCVNAAGACVALRDYIASNDGNVDVGSSRRSLLSSVLLVLSLKL